MSRAPRRKVFVSYHHTADASWYDRFVDVFSETYQIVRDNSVDRAIGSEDADYVIRRIRDNYLTGSSATIVLCGKNTWGRKYVDWEILSSLNQRMGLIGLILPSNVVGTDGKHVVPERLMDNIKQGYARWRVWSTVRSDPRKLSLLIEEALTKDKGLIDNSCPKRLRNASLR